MRRSLLLVVALVGCASRDPAPGVGVVEQPFTATGSLAEVRENFGVAVLPSGSVMVVGGFSTASGTQLNEHWDPATGTWTQKKELSTQRSFVSATTLPSGKVLVLGGSDATGEIYDPAINEWIPVTSDGRKGVHASVLLSTGKVLVVGTDGSTWVQPRLYDPVSDAWSTAGSTASPMIAPREDHAAHLLYDGRVAILGGYNGAYLSSVELYAPVTNTWSAGGALKAARQSPASAVLADKRILVAGGYNGSGLSSAEIYDPISNTSALTTSMSKRRASAAAVALPSGRVLVIGGDNGLDATESSSEVYDPTTKTWSPGPNLTTPRYAFGAALVSGGRVLVVGGRNGTTKLSTAEVFGGLALGSACVIDEECTTGKCEASKCAPAPMVDAGTDTMTTADTAVADGEAPDTATPIPDTGSVADAGPTEQPASESDGCGCRTAGRGGGDHAAALLIACAVAALVRRSDKGSSGGRRTRR